MVQRVTVTAETPVELKPLIQSAIRAELKTLAHGIERTRERLAAFEKQSGLSSAEFGRRLAARELPDSLDFSEWQGEIETLRRLEDQQRALEQSQLS